MPRLIYFWKLFNIDSASLCTCVFNLGSLWIFRKVLYDCTESAELHNARRLQFGITIFAVHICQRGATSKRLSKLIAVVCLSVHAVNAAPIPAHGHANAHLPLPHLPLYCVRVCVCVRGGRGLALANLNLAPAPGKFALLLRYLCTSGDAVECLI